MWIGSDFSPKGPKAAIWEITAKSNKNKDLDLNPYTPKALDLESNYLLRADDFDLRVDSKRDVF